MQIGGFLFIPKNSAEEVTSLPPVLMLRVAEVYASVAHFVTAVGGSVGVFGGVSN